MWCFCTPSSHHACNSTIGMIKCNKNIEHCVIGRSGLKFTQSCWEWKTILVCPDNVGQCYIIGNNLQQPACCCKGHLCNSKMVKMLLNRNIGYQTTESFSISSETTIKSDLFIIIIIVLALFMALTFILIILVQKSICRKSLKIKQRSSLYEIDQFQMLLDNTFDDNLISKCSKEKLIAHGRFGQVWLGNIALKENKMEQNKIAIKIFTNTLINARSWENESLIYSLLKLQNHPNILYCFGAEKVQQQDNLEMWLVVQYHSIGSLYEYLKQYSIKWPMLLSVSQNIAAGLSHLHSFSQTGIFSIAHRDIKSKNILLKENLSACIADFGLAICQKNYEMCIKNRVGTYNYMAPEMLEGSINLTVLSFLPADIFSMSLVFWELLNRCRIPGVMTSAFTFAFENIVGEQPTLEEMRYLVVKKQFRPKFKEYWSYFPEIMMYWGTICECWDEDPEARLSSECVKIRLEKMQIQNECLNISHKM